MTKNDSLIRLIADNALIAAVYFILTMLTGSFAYLDIQFRIAEILVLLCFWRPDFVIGVTVGCFLSNIASSVGPIDMVVGTGATLISSLLIAYASPRMLVATFYPILANAFAVGAELYFVLNLTPQIPLGNIPTFWVLCLWVGIGEGAVIIFGYVLWVLLSRSKTLFTFLKPTRHVEIHW